MKPTHRAMTERQWRAECTASEPQTRGRDQTEKIGKPAVRSGSCRNCPRQKCQEAPLLMTPSTSTSRWWCYPGTQVCLQDHHSAFRLPPTAANRINTASSPHTPGLPARGLQPSRLVPRLPLHLSGSNWPKVSSILGSHRGRVYTRLRFVQRTRERDHGEKAGSCRALQDLQEFSGWRWR